VLGRLAVVIVVVALVGMIAVGVVAAGVVKVVIAAGIVVVPEADEAHQELAQEQRASNDGADEEKGLVHDRTSGWQERLTGSQVYFRKAVAEAAAFRTGTRSLHPFIR
jgi:hypothetical protein